MNLLLDTCTFLWAAADAPQLSPIARRQISDTQNSLYLSAVSGWEIAIKYAGGQLRIPELPENYIRSRRTVGGIHSLPLDERSAVYAASLPLHHKDPFDRMLICQAIVHELTILSPDPMLAKYQVSTLW